MGKGRAISEMHTFSMLRLSVLLIAVALAGCSQFVHMPPGTSVEIALARKPEVMRVPEMQAPSQPARVRTERELGLAPIEPTLPTNDSVTAVAEAYARGNEALQRGEAEQAISAFQQAVKLDPKFGQAWQMLAMAFEKAGKPDKAREAYKHSKGATEQ